MATIRYEHIIDTLSAARGVTFELSRSNAGKRVGIRWLGNLLDVQVVRRAQSIGSACFYTVLWPGISIPPGSYVGIILEYSGSCGPQAPKNVRWLDSAALTKSNAVYGYEYFLADVSTQAQALRPINDDLTAVVVGADATYHSARMPVAYFLDHPDPYVATARSFFFDMEVSFVAPMFQRGAITYLETVRRAGAVTKITAELEERVKARITTPNASTISLKPIDDVAALQHLSSLLIQVVCAHFCGGLASVTVLRFRDLRRVFTDFADRAFVSGDTVESLNCEPDSDRFFLFGEFALACVATQVHESFWWRFLCWTIPSLQAFYETYSNGSERRWGDYARSATLPRKRRMESDNYRRLLKCRRVSVTTLHEELTGIVRRAYHV